METNTMPSAGYSQNGIRSGSGSTSNHGRLWLEFKASLDRTQNTNPYSYFGKLTVSTKYLPSLTLFLLLDTRSTEMNTDTGVDGHTGAKDGSVVSVAVTACGTASAVQWVNSSFVNDLVSIISGESLVWW